MFSGKAAASLQRFFKQLSISEVIGVTFNAPTLAYTESLLAPTVSTSKVVTISAAVQDLLITQYSPTVDVSGSVPQEPTNFRKTTSLSTELSLAWDAMASTDSYSLEVYRYDEGNGWVYDLKHSQTGITTTTYTVTGLLDSAMYECRLKGVNTYGASTEAIIWVPAGELERPDTIDISATTESSITISWTGGHADTYDMIRGVEGSGETTIATGLNYADGSYTDSTVAQDTGYYYYLKCYSAAGGSAVVYSVGAFGVLGTMYVSDTGSDVDSYGTITSPWKTISKLNSYPIHQNATARFDGGYSYDGAISIQNSGFTLNSYGTGKAVISSGAQTAVTGHNLDNITIDNIELFGQLSISDTVHGIHLSSDLAADAKLPNVTITNCDIHDFAFTGIFLEGQNVSTGFDGVTIDGCNIYNIYYAGILTRGVFDSAKTTYAHHNVTITNTECYDIVGHVDMTDTNTGQGIQVSDAKTVLIENCIARDSAQNGRGGAIGIWAWDSDNVTMQYCEAYNISSGRDNKDGAGFDLDGGCTNSTVQYCYAHDNEGGGVIIGQFDYARPMDNNVIRYNILTKNSIRGGEGLGFFCGGNTTMDNTYAYNNTVFFDDTTKPAVGYTLWDGGTLGNLYLYNNLLYGTVTTPSTGVTMGTNWQVADGDPLLVNTAAGTAEGYKLQDTSPLVNAGADYSLTTGGKDYFGNNNLHASNYDIGAHENHNVAANVSVSPTTQTLSIALYSVSVTAVDNSGGSFDADYQAVLDYATANSIALPDSAQQTADNDFMVELKNSGAWARAGSVMKFSGTADAAFKLIDWKQLVQRSAYGSVTWSTSGAKGNGANAYIVGQDMSLITEFTGTNAGIFWNMFERDPNTSGWYIMTGNYTANIDTRWYVIPSSSRVDVNSSSMTGVSINVGVSSVHYDGADFDGRFYDSTGALTTQAVSNENTPVGAFGIFCRLLDDDSPASYSSDGLKCIIYGDDMSDIESAVRTALGTL